MITQEPNLKLNVRSANPGRPSRKRPSIRPCDYTQEFGRSIEESGPLAPRPLGSRTLCTQQEGCYIDPRAVIRVGKTCELRLGKHVKIGAFSLISVESDARDSIA